MTLAVDPPRSAGLWSLETTDLEGRRRAAPSGDALTIVSLFSGVAGLDSGMEAAGSHVAAMCESWGAARRVLHAHYPETPIAKDVSTFTPAVSYEVLAAGFPCTDLSHAGGKAGIFGPQSGLVEHVFRIARTTRPEWIVLENVPNLLTLHKGAGIREVVTQLEALGYSWAYRTVDSRFTGVPQRRYRVILLASLTHDPAARLLGEDTEAPALDTTQAQPEGVRAQAKQSGRLPHGFYWTEGRTGLGLVEGAIPTLKGGSMLGAPSAPAIWFPDAPLGRKFVLPRIEDGEQLQGLPVGWVDAARVDGEKDLRWKLLGNAVTRGVGQWVGDRLRAPITENDHRFPLGRLVEPGSRWPKAAIGGPGRTPREVRVSDHPRRLPITPLSEIVDVADAPPLSHRATRGFLSRVDETNRRLDERLYADLEAHLSASRDKQMLPAGSWAASVDSRARMQAQRQRDTKPELAMRRELTALGLRYQLQRRPEPDLRSRLDIVFKGAKVAVDIRGCFWHSCSQHGTSPKPSAERWAEKLRRNRERDDQMVADLTARGWIVCVVWEHDNPAAKAADIAAIVGSRRPTRSGGSRQRPK